MALIKRSANEYLEEAMRLLRENTPITNFNAGSIARALAESMKNEIPDLYAYAQETMNVGFISKSSDEYLDLIGALFSYPRRTEEKADEDGNITSTKIDNETYRFEISQQTLAMASANHTALRLAILTVPGVADCIGKEYTHGTGSFSFTVVPQYGFSLSSIQSGVESAMSETKGFGIRPNIIFPIQIPLDLSVQLSFNDSAATSARENVKSVLRAELYKYFGNFTRGQAFIYNELVAKIMESKEVADFTIIKFYLNGEPSLLMNQNILSDEIITPSTITIT